MPLEPLGVAVLLETAAEANGLSDIDQLARGIEIAINPRFKGNGSEKIASELPVKKFHDVRK
jgi:hypothetical protein